jgi:hypothetical protein
MDRIPVVIRVVKMEVVRMDVVRVVVVVVLALQVQQYLPLFHVCNSSYQ